MNPVADHVVVVLLLAVSVGYAVTKLGPRALRRHIQAVVSKALTLAPSQFGLQGLAQRLTAVSVQAPKGACGGGESCGSDAAATKQGNEGEVSVPIGKIGRRAVDPAHQ